ncbi:MAG: histidine ammonia-lyase [Candidatus Brocadiales bacterium]|nr:histidine ammonia-lyase [Candidatus Bathyanammoxibius amoris]
MNEINLDGNHLTIAELADIAKHETKISLAPSAADEMGKARSVITDALRDKKTVYGVTTGFGALAGVILSKDQTKDLQRNILLSHSAGVGRPFDRETTRAIMALRVNSLAKGFSGIRPGTVNTLVEMANKGVLPVIPEKGSVGASGDLAPLAHMGLVMIGEGEAVYNNERVSGAEAMRKAGISKLQLQEGEGLALINGTQVMTALGALAVYGSSNLAKAADIAAAMTLEVLSGSNMELNPKIHLARPHPGQSQSAENLRKITAGSAITTSHKDFERVQSAYTIRCSPQVHGASKDALSYARETIETEMNSATDNPMVFHETGEILNGGNFHGQPVGLAMDFLTIGLAELGNISERRTERLVNPQLSGLPAFLTKNPGLNSGLMLAQYTAAALVSENKVLSHPATVDSIPTSANKEDHVSMGTIAARKCRDVLKNAEYVIAIELLCAAQALDLFTNLRPGGGTLAAYNLIREHVTHMEVDRILSNDIETVYGLLHSGTIVAAVEEKTGRLN